VTHQNGGVTRPLPHRPAVRLMSASRKQVGAGSASHRALQFFLVDELARGSRAVPTRNPERRRNGYELRKWKAASYPGARSS
jgi:hypothetical protein